MAIVEAKPTRNNYKNLFDNEFEFDLFQLTSQTGLTKVLKRDVDLDVSQLDNYKWVILVGTEPFEYIAKLKGITNYTGKLVNEKYLPCINPGMLKIKPEAQGTWDKTKQNILGYLIHGKQDSDFDRSNLFGIQDEAEAMNYLEFALHSDKPYIALDTETTALYPRNGHIIGISLTYEKGGGAYIDTDCVSERVENLLQTIFNKKKVVFHNAKFDLGFLEYHFNFKFPDFEDTMLLHYVLDETKGTHGLKDLASKYTVYGDYEQPQAEWIKEYCRKNKIKKEDFTYDLIPFDIISQYAAIDTAVTFELFEKFAPLVEANPKFRKVYRELLLPGTVMLKEIQDNGVPFDIDRLNFVQLEMGKNIDAAVAGLYEFKEVQQFQEKYGNVFNPNSPIQLRKLLFDELGLPCMPGKLTGTGAISTDAEVLAWLADQHPLPKYILDVRKSSKIKNTYVDKIIPQLDRDKMLRTGFSLHTTTSGRLSSSGKLNMQQLPRDNPAVKGCIRSDGYKIVSVDLKTAEMYYAAVISQDLELMDIFRLNQDFHSSIAQKVFKLECPVEEIATKHKLERQASKAVSFGILYGSGPDKVAQTVGISLSRAKQIIKEYYDTFWTLKEWLEETQEFIAQNAYIYTPFGRKRRLPNVRSDNQGIKAHEIRSGVNAVIQSCASDVNLLATIDMQNYIKTNKLKSEIFGMVHDSILARVLPSELEEYTTKLGEFIQLDRGVSIPGSPIGYDVEIGDDYSFTKFDKIYGDAYKAFING